MEAHQRGLDENGERDYDYGGAVHGQQLVPLPAAGGVGAASAILNRAEVRFSKLCKIALGHRWKFHLS